MRRIALCLLLWSGVASADTFTDHATSATSASLGLTPMTCGGVGIDDTARLIAANAAAVAANGTILIPCRVRLNTPAGTISAPIRFEASGALDTLGGGTVTLTGAVTAPNTQIVYGTGVTFHAKMAAALLRVTVSPMTRLLSRLRLTRRLDCAETP
jgi:hypothetical protein